MPLIDLPLADIDFGVPLSCRFQPNPTHRRRLNQVPPENLPPVVVFHEVHGDGTNLYRLADGGYRYAAAEHHERPTLLADVRPGNLADAVLYHCQANSRHGQPRSNADKRDAVLRLLGNPLFVGRSDCWIAEHCKVSHTFVANLRQRTSPSTAARRGRDGKLRKLPVPSPDPIPSKSSRDAALDELARAKAEIDEAIRAAKRSGIERSEPKILKKLRAARQEVLRWEETLRQSPPEAPIPDPDDTSPAGILAAEIYRVRRLEPAEFLGYANKVMSHDRETLKPKGERRGSSGDAELSGERSAARRSPSRRSPPRRSSPGGVSNGPSVPGQSAVSAAPLGCGGGDAESGGTLPGGSSSGVTLPGGGSSGGGSPGGGSTGGAGERTDKVQPPEHSRFPDFLAHRVSRVEQPATKRAPPRLDLRGGPPEISPFVGLLGYAPVPPPDPRGQPATKRAG